LLYQTSVASQTLTPILLSQDSCLKLLYMKTFKEKTAAAMRIERNSQFDQTILGSSHNPLRQKCQPQHDSTILSSSGLMPHWQVDCRTHQWVPAYWPKVGRCWEICHKARNPCWEAESKLLPPCKCHLRAKIRVRLN